MAQAVYGLVAPEATGPVPGSGPWISQMVGMDGWIMSISA